MALLVAAAFAGVRWNEKVQSHVAVGPNFWEKMLSGEMVKALGTGSCDYLLALHWAPPISASTGKRRYYMLARVTDRDPIPEG